MAGTIKGEYPGEPLPDEDIESDRVEVATRWVRNYTTRVRESAAALADLLTKLEGAQADGELLDEQQRRLREAENLMARVRYWNDREAALRKGEDA